MIVARYSPPATDQNAGSKLKREPTSSNRSYVCAAPNNQPREQPPYLNQRLKTAFEEDPKSWKETQVILEDIGEVLGEEIAVGSSR